MALEQFKKYRSAHGRQGKVGTLENMVTTSARACRSPGREGCLNPPTISPRAGESTDRWGPPPNKAGKNAPCYHRGISKFFAAVEEGRWKSAFQTYMAKKYGEDFLASVSNPEVYEEEFEEWYQWRREREDWESRWGRS